MLRFLITITWLYFFHIPAFAQAGDTIVKIGAVDIMPPEDEWHEKEVPVQYSPSLLSAGNDPFLNAASFQFSALRFRIRGYGNDAVVAYINGIPMTDVERGIATWSLWSGLNEVFRAREVVAGLRLSSDESGGIGTTTRFESHPLRRRKETTVSYALSNRTYRHRLMFSHNTGVLKNGWAFSFSGSVRNAEDGYIPGTHYRGVSYFAGAGKKINAKQECTLLFFGAPAESGRQGPATKEVLHLAGITLYNPYWGLQNGIRRNAAVASQHQPVILLQHQFISDRIRLQTAIGFTRGKRGYTGLDWYKAPDPRPDFYRYLPSHYIYDSYQQQQQEMLLRMDPERLQINWHRLYEVNMHNKETIYNVGGLTGHHVTGLRSKYILQNQAAHTTQGTVHFTAERKVNEKWQLGGGLLWQQQRTNYYKEVADLLGGDFYVDLNPYAESDMNDSVKTQNDLNRPNRIVLRGDRFGWDYSISANKAHGWMYMKNQSNVMDAFAAMQFTGSLFWREGAVRNGAFPDHSFGKSVISTFLAYEVKAGLTWKINGRHFVFMHGAHATHPPLPDQHYLSARTRDLENKNATIEHIAAIEAGYVVNTPAVKVRLTGYFTHFKNSTDIRSFYHDDLRSMVNYALSGINKCHAGLEGGAEIKLSPVVTMQGAMALGRHRYTSRQHAVIFPDNDTGVIREEMIYSKNYYIGGSPQEAYSLGFTYRRGYTWFASFTGNYFRANWVDFNPVRRTYRATEDLTPDDPRRRAITDQEKLPEQYLLNVFGGYSFRFRQKANRDRKHIYLTATIGINNLLNDKKIITGAFEQMRFDFEERRPEKFPTKYYHGHGLTYFLNVRFLHQ